MCFIYVFVGLILRLPIWGDAADDNCFEDEVYWEVREHNGFAETTLIQINQI